MYSDQSSKIQPLWLLGSFSGGLSHLSWRRMNGLELSAEFNLPIVEELASVVSWPAIDFL